MCVKNFRQPRELFQADFLGPRPRREAGLFKAPPQYVLRPILFQELEHHFAPLRKAAFDDASERPVQGGVQQRLNAAR
jgi:hypothetical protein